MKTMLAVAATLAIVLITPLVVGKEQPSLPPDVSATDWIPVGDNLGFVVTGQVARQEPDTLNGYFMARHRDTWKKLDSEGGFRIQPLRK